jgi:hypothetical protein
VITQGASEELRDIAVLLDDRCTGPGGELVLRAPEVAQLLKTLYAAASLIESQEAALARIDAIIQQDL